MRIPISRRARLLAAAVVVVVPAVIATAVEKKAATQDDPLIAGFKQTYPASVSDAVELVTGKNGTMRHDMKLVTGKPIVGRAATSLARPVPPEAATPALATKHSVEMIDDAKPGEVGVIVMEGTLDIAAMGNLMGTAASVRGMAGMVLDGAIRDIWDIRRMGLTVYARSSTPRTAVGHYATVAKNVPVECAGVTVRPGDIIVADEDGVVVVEKERRPSGFSSRLAEQRQVRHRSLVPTRPVLDRLDMREPHRAHFPLHQRTRNAVPLLTPGAPRTHSGRRAVTNP